MKHDYGTPIPIQRDSAVTVDLEQSKAELRALKAQRTAIDNRIQELEAGIRFVERIAGERKMDEIERAVAQAQPIEETRTAVAASSHPDVKPAAISTKRKYGGPHLAKGDMHIREIALKMADDRPEGFGAMDVFGVLRGRTDLPSEISELKVNYVYIVLKRMRAEGLLEKRGHRYVKFGTAGGIVLDATVPEGFKVVPLTKEEKIRIESERYLRSRKNMTAHRAAIADHLLQIGVFRPEDKIGAVGIYFSKWPDFFHADGSGNYTFTPNPKTNGDPS